MARIKMITTNPAAEMAAAVRSPLIEAAMLSPARTKVIIRITNAPKGVFIALTIPLPVPMYRSPLLQTFSFKHQCLKSFWIAFKYEQNIFMVTMGIGAIF